MNPLKRFWEGLSMPMPREDYSIPPTASFTPRAQQVLALARKEADRFHHNFVGTEHVLLGIISLGQGTAFNVLTSMGVDLNTLRPVVKKQIGTGPDEVHKGAIPYTPRVRKVLSLAAKEAQYLKHTYVGTEHILLGLLRDGDGVAAKSIGRPKRQPRRRKEAGVERTGSKFLDRRFPISRG
jgi:ATP-dependent Clp protease ATP-binding subunit ClpA